MEDTKRHRSYLIWLLSRRDYPRRTLEEKLAKRGVSKDDTKSLLEQLIADGWYNEGTFKKVRTRQLIKRGYGPMMVKAKMGRERISVNNDEISHAYRELGTDMEAELRQQIEKHRRRYLFKELDQRDLEQKIVQALLRKGFSIAAVLQALRRPD